MRFSPRTVVWASLFVLGGLSSPNAAMAASLARQLATIFEPARVEQVSLARDGRHLGFALRSGRELQILIYELDQHGPGARMRVDAPAGARLQRLEWIAPDRLVAAVQDVAVLVLDARAQVLLRLNDAKDFLPAREKRAGRPVVRVLGAAEETDEVRLEVRWMTPDGGARLDLMSLNVRTFQRQLILSRDVGRTSGEWMLDRQGRVRILIASAGLTRTYLHLPAGGERGDWQPLDRLVAGGKASTWRVTPQNLIGERAFPLEFDRDPNVLYFASNVGRDTFGVYALDLRTQTPTGFALEDPGVDLVDFLLPHAPSGLIFDRYTQALVGFAGPGEERWLDAELATVRAEVAKKFPGRDVQILEWDDARERFLVRIAAPIDAGRFFVHHRSDGRSVEYQRDPALAADETNRSELFEFAMESGETVTGTMIWPHEKPRGGAKPALIVWFHDGPLQAMQTGLPREAQALAAVGFAVAHVNYRGSAGFGRRRRELIRTAFDRVPLEDALAVTRALVAQGSVDRTRVTAAGEGFGGYLALRARQMHPEVFCGAAAINAPLDLAQLYRSENTRASDRREVELALNSLGRQSRDLAAALDNDSTADGAPSEPPAVTMPSDMSDQGSREPVAASSFEQAFARWFFSPANRQNIEVTAELERLSGPLLLLHDPRVATPAIGPVRKLRDALARRKQVVEFVELPPQFAQGEVESRARVFREIGEFLVSCRAEAGPAGHVGASNP